ncbi:MAG: 30S ribosomal protein S16, partial [Gammaproteobacteria bacterium]|nr:30S ribosomal protein S16 [Gammaproteobacteria bacterium]
PGATGGEERLVLNLDRVTHWKGVGAQTSDRVSTLIKQAKKAAA